jgi:hypothetical protein
MKEPKSRRRSPLALALVKMRSTSVLLSLRSMMRQSYKMGTFASVNQ